jgi:hypothetical protein
MGLEIYNPLTYTQKEPTNCLDLINATDNIFSKKEKHIISIDQLRAKFPNENI